MPETHADGSMTAESIGATKMIRAIDLWLAKVWPWWRDRFNRREWLKTTLDSIGYGQSFHTVDKYGRYIHIPLDTVYLSPNGAEKP